MAAIPPKDTIYIDIDDEITGIIDKLRASDGKVVALVLPKRAAVLQSIVNMRLLKRAADDSKKHVVLITSETGLLPLAGVAGVHVAKSLSSKPEIPSAPTTNDDEETVDEDENGHLRDPEITAATAGAVAVGALAGMPPKDEVETLELDDDGDDAAAAIAGTAAVAATAAKKTKKDSKLKIPDFDRFRLKLFGSIFAVILCIVGFIFAMNVLPKATILIKTNASNVNVSIPMTLSTTATTLDETKKIVPAKVASQQKTYTQQASATGQKNTGDKATGTVDLSICVTSPGSVQNVSAGTGVSAGGHTYITQQTSNFTYAGSGGSCFRFKSTGIAIVAQSAGAAYNTSASVNFTVAGRSDVTATGSASGGTDNVVTVVSQADIDGAKAKITTDDASVKEALGQQLTHDGYYPVTATYSAGTPAVTTSANAGDTASNVTVTEVVTYTMYGAHEADLKVLVDANVKTQTDTSKQSILSDGLATATFTVQTNTPTNAQVTMQTTAIVGPHLDEAQIKKDAAGKKEGDVKAQVMANPGVTDVEVSFSPFWVTKVPSNPDKVTVIIAKPTTTASSSNGSNP